MLDLERGSFKVKQCKVEGRRKNETNRVGHEGRRDWVLDGGRRCAQGPNGLEGGGKREGRGVKRKREVKRGLLSSIRRPNYPFSCLWKTRRGSRDVEDGRVFYTITPSTLK